MIRSMVVAVAMLFVTPLAIAEDSFFLFGASIGKVEVEVDAGFDARSTGWSVFAGYEFNRYLSIEAGYMDGGSFSDEVGSFRLNGDLSALHGSVIGSLPISDNFALFARAGMLRWDADYRLTQGGQFLIRVEETGTDPYFGGGLAVRIDGALLRAEYTIAEIEDTDLAMISASIVWRF